MMPTPFGFLIIDKPKGVTSHDCVKTIRKLFSIKKVGHGGTLDPGVTGVLPIALGNATRLLPYLAKSKTYKAIIQLGTTTTTDDLFGDIIAKAIWPEINKNELEKYLDQFRGKFLQQPPNISSVHIEGERAYKRARRGEAFSLPSKEINIYELLLLNWDQETGELEINVHCSPGTYIRSIARDLGIKLGCGGCLARLRRTQAQGFQEREALQLPSKEDLNQSFKDCLIQPIEALSHLPKITLTTLDELNCWRKGQQLTISKDSYEKTSLKNKSEKIDQDLKNILVVVDKNQTVQGIAEWNELKKIKPKVVFNAHG